MRRAELQYDLSPERIARQPVQPRDHSRLLVMDRRNGPIEHRRFRDIREYLRPADCLVLNNTSVIPAQFRARRSSGGEVEGLFLREDRDGWGVLLKPSSRLRVGERLVLLDTSSDVSLLLRSRLERGEWRAEISPHRPALQWLAEFGRPPLPPYIRASRRAAGVDEYQSVDPLGYQTVYAARPGAVAAPTAGLHFTPQLLAEIGQRGVHIAYVTLHVGQGTFAAIEADDLADHSMHAEWYEAPAAALRAVMTARQDGGRVVAVGTTSCRVLESVARRPDWQWAGPISSLDGWTRLFLYPPCEFHLTDALLTNFHLPESTLLALVMGLASPERIRSAYAEAIAREYRFYSFGDAMLIL